MKNLFNLLLLIFIINQLAFSQVAFLDPSISTQYDSITVYFDATQTGGTELLNYTGIVYAHTGVTIDSAGIKIKEWQYVIGSWGSSSQPALTRVSTNFYKLVISFPRQFYHVNNSNEKIIKLDLVFRSADASKQSRPDIHIDLYDPGLNLIVQSPEVSVTYGDPQRSPAFVKGGTTVPINLSAVELSTKVSTLKLFVDGNQVAQSTSKTLSYNFVHSNYSVGPHSVVAIGTDTTGNVDSTSFMMFCNPEINNVPLPNGIRPGINYIGPTTATLALFAPHKEFIYAIGDFNDWIVNTNYFMNRDSVSADSVIWWVEINSLSPGTEYAFQYYVDGDIRTGDPYSEKILDPWNDKYITSITYPALKSYPTGKTESIVSVLKTTQSQYQWQVENFQKPPKENLIVYELLVRDFSAQHDYQFLIDTLSYLKSLGVNAIELMPIMEFSGNLSWGYNPIYHTAVDKYYGTANKLKEFIDVCHQNGIAVILDMVLNQADNLSPLAMLWWDNVNSRPATNNPYLNPIAKHPFNVFNDFNHESNATKYFVDRVNEFWLTNFKVDGFRFDLSKGFTQVYNTDVGTWSNYDQSRINILERMANKIWQVDSSAYVILEHFAANNEEIALSNYGMMLWGNHNCNYNQATMGYQSGDCGTWDFSGISYKNRSWNNPNLVGYMESHDEERLMYKNLQYGNSSGTYNIKYLGEALNRMKLAAAFFFTVPGPKMIWQFGELGYDISIDVNGRTGEKPIKWDYYNDSGRKKLYKVFKTLIDLKESYDVFSTDDFSIDASSTIKKINLYDPSMDIFIIGNFGVISLNPNQNFSKTGWWYDYFSGDSVEVTNLTEPISLLPGEFKIYSSVKLPTPEADLLTEVDQENPSIVKEFNLEQNYPNPFNPSTIIRYSIVSPSIVTLKIYDILGREVKTLVNQEQNNGTYEVNWNGDNEFGNKVSTGVYFYKIDAGTYSDVKKMLLIK
ncbi:MAG: alpha-amylase family glycosyl hydrolase [Ignavibacteriaceae bacterium]